MTGDRAKVERTGGRSAGEVLAGVVGDVTVDFGDLPEAVDNLLRAGVAAFRRDRGAADALFREALAVAPDALPAYLCLYKIHAYRGSLDEALAMARAGLGEAARQAGLDADWHCWPRRESWEGPARFALYTLKACAFIHLRRQEPEAAAECLAVLAQIDPRDCVGASVVAAIAAGADG